MIDRPDSRRSEAEDDEGTVRLLRLADLRADVPSDRSARVRSAFLEECRSAARGRSVRRRILIATGCLAAAAALMVAVRLGSPRGTALQAHPVVATVDRVDGSGARRMDDRTTATSLRPALDLRARDWVETDNAGRVAFRLADGASVRLDRASRARFLSPTVLELARGAVYIDSDPGSAALEIRTDIASVRDIGTQFEVRHAGGELRVRVRSGAAEVRRGEEIAAALPATEVIVDRGGMTTRPFAAYGPAWAWTASLAAFESDGRSLDDFLDRLCREQGWTLTYADPSLARAASGMILRGSTSGLEPSQALAVVMATTGLTHRLADGELQVARQNVR